MQIKASLKEQDEGFSLIELLVVLSLVAIMSVIGMTSYQGYDKSQDHRGATREVVGFLRNSQVRAVAEATTYQCEFTTSELRIYRDAAVPPTTTPVRTYSLTDLPAYVHSDPGPSFFKLHSIIRELLDTVISSKYFSIALSENKPSYHHGMLNSGKIDDKTT